jgi:uncharacterized protein (TIGR02284 family)
LENKEELMASNQHDIDVLNGLIEMTLDSAHGYDEATKDVKNPRFKTLFGARAIERKQVTAELQTEVRRLLGGKPETTGTTMGKVHRTFLNIKSSLFGDDQTVVNEVEAGEDRIKAKYEKAFNDNDISAPVRDLISRAYVSVREGHDQMRDLKHHMQAAE